MMYPHYTLVKEWPWPSFEPKEMACRHCGELRVNTQFMDKLQKHREQLDKPVLVLSAYRCAIHNAFVGGAPLSMHRLGRACDQKLFSNLNGNTLLASAAAAGFTGFGIYGTFIHIDDGKPRQWAS